jgi:hypothetical protein
VLAARVAPLVSRDALAAVLGANERMRNRVEEVVDLDV